MIQTMLLFGATGDLAGRLLFPALATLHAADHLSPDFRLVATSRREWDDAQFRKHMTSRLEQHGSHLSAESKSALVNATTHIQSDLEDQGSIAEVIRFASNNGASPIAVYLALPQGMFASLAGTIHDIGLPPSSRLVIEKPFGESLEGALELSEVLEPFTQKIGPDALYLVDHVLGMATVQNLVSLRFTNPILETVWNSQFIEQINVLWDETMALEGRASFYDKAGALKDVLQNHMIQVLCYAAMEPPASLAATDIQDRKVELLKAIHPLSEDDVINNTIRARYTAGTLVQSEDSDARDVPDYVDEDGIDPTRDTETFAEVALNIDNERWDGTRFVLRTGKALAQRRKEVVVHFRPGSGALFQSEGNDADSVQPNNLHIGIDGPLDITLQLNSTADDSTTETQPIVLASPPLTPGLPPYASVLLDILSGGSSRSVRPDEAEEAWRVVMPVLDGWEKNLTPVREYAAGSDGPHRQ